MARKDGEMNDDDVCLRPAHAWDCPACGAENFAKCIDYEMSEEEQRSLMRAMGQDPDGFEAKQAEAEGFVMGGGMVTAPNEVTCAKCEKTFKVWVDPDSIVPDDAI